MKKLFSKSIVVVICAAIAVLVWATPVDKYFVSGIADPDVLSVTAHGPLYDYQEPYHADWPAGMPAVLTWVHSYWGLYGGTIPGANWISTAYLAEPDLTSNSWRWFHADLIIPCTAYDISPGTVYANSDNAEGFWFNRNFIGSDGFYQSGNAETWDWEIIVPYQITPQPGINDMDFIVCNYAGGSSPEANPTGLIFKVELSYKLPDAIFQPPIANDSFELKDGTTLPIKFMLYKQDGTLITDIKTVKLTVRDGFCGPSPGTIIDTWNLGEGSDSLRFDPIEYYYIANFHTKNYTTLQDAHPYSAVVYDVCSGDVLGCIDFILSETKGNRANK